MSVHRVPEVPCPVCGHALNAAGDGTMREDTPAPSPGDWTVCIGCATALCFNHDLTLRQPVAEDYLSLDDQLTWELQRAQSAIRAVKKKAGDAGL